jgi:hypothetical protein
MCRVSVGENELARVNVQTRYLCVCIGVTHLCCLLCWGEGSSSGWKLGLRQMWAWV